MGPIQLTKAHDKGVGCIGATAASASRVLIPYGAKAWYAAIGKQAGIKLGNAKLLFPIFFPREK